MVYDTKPISKDGTITLVEQNRENEVDDHCEQGQKQLSQRIFNRRSSV